jgi:hypothetical protein
VKGGLDFVLSRPTVLAGLAEQEAHLLEGFLECVFCRHRVFLSVSIDVPVMLERERRGVVERCELEVGGTMLKLWHNFAVYARASYASDEVSVHN